VVELKQINGVQIYGIPRFWGTVSYVLIKKGGMYGKGILCKMQSQEGNAGC
jgi:hypothetical protein